MSKFINFIVKSYSNKMIETIKGFLLVIILVYAIVITILYWQDQKNMQNYLKTKEENLLYKSKELDKRENLVVDKEVCFRELTKLKTVQNTVIEVLKSASENSEAKSGIEKFDNVKLNVQSEQSN